MRGGVGKIQLPNLDVLEWLVEILPFAFYEWNSGWKWIEGKALFDFSGIQGLYPI